MSGEETLAFEAAFDSRDLELINRFLRRRFGEDVIVRTDEFGGLLVDMHHQVIGERLPTEVIAETAPRAVEFAHFLTWWDHFKATYRGRWWMRWRKWPVAYKVERRDFTARVVVNLERFREFPEANFPMPELGQPIRVMRPRVNWIGWMD